MHSSVLYLSRSLLPSSGGEDNWLAIQDVSLTRNSDLGLTGLLIVTPDYFTQFLEGEKSSIECVMASIRADPRHTDIFETDTTAKFPTVQFPTWRMAGFPPAASPAGTLFRF